MGHHDHTQDHQQVSVEVAVTDAVTFLFGQRSSATPGAHKSNFEGRKLNAMLDLVDHGEPGQLTSAGEALWRARDAISDAADELDGHIGAVDWHGEAGSSFQKWGGNLVTNTRELAKFAGDAGTHITLAGSGLSSVRSSMPPRDNRVEQKTVEQIPEHKRVKGDPDYDAAVKVEEHRQEAINQMIRLASFYSVASTSLAGQEPPKFTPMPDVGVPKPVMGWGGTDRHSSTRTGDLGTVSSDGSDQTSHATGDVSSRHQTQLESHGLIRELEPPEVSTEIDSVAPPVPVTPPTETVPTPQLNPQGPTNNPSLPFAPAPIGPGQQNTISKAFGKAGSTSPQARGAVREGMAGNRNTSPMGRGPANAMGRGPVNEARGVGRAGATSGHAPMGRGGVTGGTPRAAGPAKSSQAGAVRKGGVVGGRPNAGQASGSSSRVPRGTVIGGRQDSGGRTQGTAGKVGQRGVIGAPKTTVNKTPSAPRTPTAPEGVLGAPKGRTTGPKGERAGFTAGGSGLVRDKKDQRASEGGTENTDETLLQHEQDMDAAPQHRPPNAPSVND